MGTIRSGMVTAQRIEITFRPVSEAKKDCERCHGTGKWGRIDCPCRAIFSKPKEIKLAVVAEEMPNGGVNLDFEEVKERGK